MATTSNPSDATLRTSPPTPTPTPYSQDPATETASGAVGRDEASTVIAASVRLYRDGLAVGLEGRKGARVAARAATAPEAVAAVRETRPDVLLIDISMSDALAAIHSVQEEAPGTKVIAFAVDDDHDDEVLTWAEAGVAGWVGRDGSLVDLMAAIRNAARGELACSARMAGLLAKRVATLAGRATALPESSTLTPREREVAELLSQGLSNKQIARALSIRVSTVKNHVHNILTKLGASSRSEAGARLREAISSGEARSGS